MLHSSVRSFGLLIAAVFAALLWLPCGSSAVYAACGDYVHVGRGDANSGLIADRAEPGTSRASKRHLPEPTAPPCPGSNCRQGPIAPLSPVPAPVSNGADQKACLAPAKEAAPVAIECIAPDPALRADDCLQRQIERPPRNCS